MRFSDAGMLAALIGLLGMAQAQEVLPTLDPNQPVALTADNVTYDTATGRVVATGAVEVYYGDRTLTADSITYDDQTQRITATGNIVVRDPSGATVFADAADLDVDLRDGLVRGAKAMLAKTVRLSAVEARRIDGRYNTLNRAVYSACEVCAEDPTPLWQIRARKIIHDEVEHTIHYEDATFDLFGIPIAWSPYFSHPDPTVQRASGFLAPSFEQSTNFGYGVKLPYYIVLDDQSDLTLTPYATTDKGVIGIAEYRRAFENGAFRVQGSVTRNDINGEQQFQGHIDTDGRFNLTPNTYWGWDATIASDDAYLRFFELSNADRLTSEAYIRNYGTRGYFDATAVYFQSLRDNEAAGQIPLVLPDISARREYTDDFTGGDFGVFFDNQVLLRNNGLDSSRISIGLDWERQVITPQGISLRGFGQMRGDAFLTNDNPNDDDNFRARFAPMAGVEARYPLIWDQESGIAHVFEPIAQAILAPHGGNGSDIVDEDSLVTEFDDTNLFDINHFSGLDGFEEGPRFNLGLRYERVVDDGLKIDATVGRVLRFTDADEFSSGSGLSTAQSDWVGAWGISFDPYFTLRQRLRVSDDSAVTRNEVFADASLGPVDLTAAYVFLESDPEIGALLDREEVTAGGAVALTPNWSISAYTQRDLAEREFVEVAGGLTYTNECCAIDLFLRRRFTDQDNAPASTSVGVQIKLLTLGGDDGEERSDPVSLRRARWQR